MARRQQHIDLFLSVQREADLLSGTKLVMVQVLFENLCACLSAAQGHGFQQADDRRQSALAQAQKIIKGLQLTLDTKNRPVLSASSGQLYSYMGARLWHAHVHRDNAAIGEVLSLSRTLTTAWQSLSKGAPTWPGATTYKA